MASALLCALGQKIWLALAFTSNARLNARSCLPIGRLGGDPRTTRCRDAHDECPGFPEPFEVHCLAVFFQPRAHYRDINRGGAGPVESHKVCAREAGVVFRESSCSIPELDR